MADLCGGDCGDEATLIVELDFGDMPMCRECAPMYQASEGYIKIRKAY